MVLIDSSSWIEALRQTGRPEVKSRVHALMTAGQAAWCDVVRLELWAGARGPHEKKALAHLGSTIQNLKIDDLVWQAAIKLAEKARDAGLNVPACDLIIVSCARRHGVPIEHCDKHIAHLQSLLT